MSMISFLLLTSNLDVRGHISAERCPVWQMKGEEGCEMKDKQPEANYLRHLKDYHGVTPIFPMPLVFSNVTVISMRTLIQDQRLI